MWYIYFAFICNHIFQQLCKLQSTKSLAKGEKLIEDSESDPLNWSKSLNKIKKTTLKHLFVGLCNSTKSKQPTSHMRITPPWHHTIYKNLHYGTVFVQGSALRMMYYKAVPIGIPNLNVCNRYTQLTELWSYHHALKHVKITLSRRIENYYLRVMLKLNGVCKSKGNICGIVTK